MIIEWFYAMSLVEQVLREKGFEAEETPKTIKDVIELALRAGVKPNEVAIVKRTPRDPTLIIRNKVVASWIPLR